MSDTLIQQLMESAAKKRAAIEKTQGYTNKTNLSFPLDERNIRENVNLNVVNNIDEIVRLLAVLKEKQKNISEAASELGVKSSFKWGGFSYNNWRDDMRNRVETIQLRNKKNELKEIESQLNELMSPEMQKNIKLAEIQKKLEKDD